ncbi:phosphopyruvate hydratase [Caballeronia sp. INDeC2]|uniref:phosphopyruvate hydratase n=1 Tax=Caballeronia sp. INDeC2 TaxID=2921747 RepID=UPI0020296655|nr:phosphopyruvate hydratase [Caballeronia sp. INDeC2]
MSRIDEVRARRIWDSRGRPTVEVDIVTETGARGRGIAPAGASRGSREAVELRDGGTAFDGKDVKAAIAGIAREIAPALRGHEVAEQAAIDAMLIALDGTPDKSRLGGNALIATSLAALHAAANERGVPLWRHVAGENEVTLPLPQIQIFGGGAHADRRVDVQDFMVIAMSATSFAQALEMTAEVYLQAGKLMRKRGAAQGVADEGGWWPAFASNEEAMDVLVASIEAAGFVPGTDVGIALDIAASEFGRGGWYTLGLDDVRLDTDAMIEKLSRWIERYPIVSIEDPLAEDDEAGMIAFTRAVGSKVQIVGDDFLVTRAALIDEAARKGACNAALIKLNQAGTVTETLAALQASRRNGYASIVSARSGETEDVTIVHLATGWNAGQLKVGSFSRSERMAKWNEGVRIEEGGGPAMAFATAAGLLRG